MSDHRMRKNCLFAAFVFTCPAFAGDEAHFVFNHASGDPHAIAVPNGASFDHAKGYGFEPEGAVVDAGAHCSGPASPTIDPIATTDRITRFSVSLPEGSYHISLHFRKAPLGTITAEARRYYFLPKAPGPSIGHNLSFVLDLHNSALPPLPLNAPGGTAVRLNPRECGSYSWDNKLTIGYSDLVERLDITPVDVPRLFLLGDSTVADQPQAPYAGWGQMLPLLFGPDIAVANHAESGETLKSFLAELRLDKILSQAKPGDWALIQFSHNDEKAQWPQTHEPADSTFPLYLKVYIAELRRKGVQPVLVTPMQRLRFNGDGKIIETHGAYPAAIRAVAEAEGIPLIDLTALSTRLFETLGAEKARDAFAGHGADATHQSVYGAFELVRCIAKALREQKLPLAQYLKPEIPAFDPVKPDQAGLVTP